MNSNIAILDSNGDLGDGGALLNTLVTLTGSETLTNKTITAPVIATISNTGTVTLPTATDTLVAKATTDILTNKTIDGDNNTITNIGAGEMETGSTEDTQTGTASTPYVLPSGFHWVQVDATYTFAYDIQINSGWRTVETGIAAVTPRFIWSDGTNMRVHSNNDSGVIRILSMN